MHAGPHLLVAVLVAALAGCFAGTEPMPEERAPEPEVPARGGLRLLVLGDTGTGEEGQHQVALAALAVCAARGCDAALLLGDNIYETGVDSPTDPQFETKFEEPYRDFAIPFYAVLGNHDDGGRGLGFEAERGDHQVAYAARTDRTSDKFRMPARYYDVRLGDVHLFGLDGNTVFYGGLLGARDPLALAQETWLREGLDASDARWKLTFSHWPYLTNGQHGNAVAPDRAGVRLERFYEEAVCGRADLVLAGHDHDLQWLKAVPRCGATEFIVSGAAAKQRPLGDPDRHEAWFQKGETLGFAWLHIEGDELTGVFFDGDGALLYERTMTKPAPGAAAVAEGRTRAVTAASVADGAALRKVAAHVMPPDSL